MAKFVTGDLIGIPCKVEEGPFDNECIVEFESSDGTVSGFTSSANIREEGGRHFIKGQILAVEGEALRVRVEGSFFTTNGLATFSSERARAQFMSLAAA